MTKHAKLLWVDLEMTGLEPKTDRILEVAAIATDWNFTEYTSYEAIIHQPDAVLKRMDGFAKTQHAASGLTDACRQSDISEAQAQDFLLQLVEEHFTAGKVILAGNSIHQDRRFIRAYWPKLDAALHYRMLDVSAWKLVFEGKYHKKFIKPEKHRALDDIRGSIDELKYYLGKVRAA